MISLYGGFFCFVLDVCFRLQKTNICNDAKLHGNYCSLFPLWCKGKLYIYIQDVLLWTLAKCIPIYICGLIKKLTQIKWVPFITVSVNLKSRFVQDVTLTNTTHLNSAAVGSHPCMLTISPNEFCLSQQENEPAHTLKSGQEQFNKPEKKTHRPWPELQTPNLYLTSLSQNAPGQPRSHKHDQWPKRPKGNSRVIDYFLFWQSWPYLIALFQDNKNSDILLGKCWVYKCWAGLISALGLLFT